jgi:hypothetical protein
MEPEVWVPIATLLLGYVGSLITEAFRDRRQRDREEAARREERRRVRDEGAAEFQRETLLRLQEALHDVGRAVSRSVHEDKMTYRKTGKWGRVLPSEETGQAGMEAYRLTHILRVRVFDDELRDLVSEYTETSTRAELAHSEQEADLNWDASFQAFQKANDRIGVLLRDLYGSSTGLLPDSR